MQYVRAYYIIISCATRRHRDCYTLIRNEVNRVLVDQKAKGATGHFREHQVVAKQLNFSRGPYDACYLLIMVGYHRVCLHRNSLQWVRKDGTGVYLRL